MYAPERAKENFPSQSSHPPKSRKTTPPQSNRRPLGAALPHSEAGQRLTALFPNGWDWIYAEPPSHHNKPEWETIKNYPLTPIEQWSHHQNPTILIGIRPAATTRWGILDIDRHSQYHPAQNPQALQTICNTLEDIGITRTLINQSSHSGGLHIYIPLPELVSSYWLSITLKYHLEAAGIQIRPGQCELFPNPKRYIPKGQGFSHFNGIRMPMQPHTGFIPLDLDLTPLPWTLEDWLNAFDLAASHQDQPKLTQQIEDAKQNHKIRTHRHPHSIDTWRERIEQEKSQGWTGPGQTNEKLKLFGCEARVFLNMDSAQQIADHIQQTAQNSPGFYDHSNHTRDIAQRSREIAQWATRYYWPLGASPSRETAYHTPPTQIASFSYHQAKREAAQERIKTALEELTQTGNLPESITARAQAIAQHAHISQKTLYQNSNKPLWHPHHLPTLNPTPEPPNPAPAEEILQPVQKSTKTHPYRSLQLLWLKQILQLFIYVGFVICSSQTQATVALTLKGQRATKVALDSPDSLEFSRRDGLGEINSSSLQPQTNPAQWSALKATLPLRFQKKLAQLQRQQLSIISAHVEQLTLFPSIPFSHPSVPSHPQFFDEDQEFNHWFELAQQLKLVNDSEWIDSEYWVEAHDRWLPYAEMVAIFPIPVLQRMLTQINRPSSPKLFPVEPSQSIQSIAIQPAPLRLKSSVLLPSSIHSDEVIQATEFLPNNSSLPLSDSVEGLDNVYLNP